MEDNSLSFILANSGIYITFLGVFLVIVIGGVYWAKLEITKSLSSEFVTHTEHKEKETEINDKFEKEINKKYQELKEQLEKLQDQYNKNNDMLIRIDTKVGLLVDDKIKKD